jgi:hypothetical protein
MSGRHLALHDEHAFVGRFTPDEEAAARAEILEALHRFARRTTAVPGDDVLRHFDARLRAAQERDERAATRA